MLNVDRKELKKGIEGIWYHIVANGASIEEHRIYYNKDTQKLEFHSYVGTNWDPMGENLRHLYTFSQHVDIEDWFDLHPEEPGAGIYWEGMDEPFTEVDFYTECFYDYILETLTEVIAANEELFDDNDYHNLREAVHEVLEELEEELALDTTKPFLQG